MIREAKVHHRYGKLTELKKRQRTFWNELTKEILTVIVSWYYNMSVVMQKRQKHSWSTSVYRKRKATWHSLFRRWWNTFQSKTNLVKTQTLELIYDKSTGDLHVKKCSMLLKEELPRFLFFSNKKILWRWKIFRGKSKVNDWDNNRLTVLCKIT